MATWRAFCVPWTRWVKTGGIRGVCGNDAALIAGVLAAALPFQVMFTVAAVILVITLAIAYLATKPLAERVLATADQLAASKGQAEGTDVEVHDWQAVLCSPFGRVILAILLVYGGWQALNGQYSIYFYGAFGIEPELSATANSLGALLGIVTIGFFARWLASMPANLTALGVANYEDGLLLRPRD